MTRQEGSESDVIEDRDSPVGHHRVTLPSPRDLLTKGCCAKAVSPDIGVIEVSLDRLGPVEYVRR